MTDHSPRASKLNNAAMIGALVFAVAAGVTGHFVLSAAISLIGAALCAAIIYREPL